MTLAIMIVYLCLLVGLGAFSGRFLKKTGGDYFLASRGIGPFMLLMSLFGTTMTAFALTGSSGTTFQKGIGVYGLLASWSGIVHPLVFFLVGARVWRLGKRHGYLTQLSFFRDRYQSDLLSLLLFPVMVSFVMLYVLMGAIGAGGVFHGIAGVPEPLGVGIVCVIVLLYVFIGGMRATAWANTVQTMLFMIMGGVAFVVIMNDLGGVTEATRRVLDPQLADPEVARAVSARAVRQGNMGQLQFLTYALVPLSAGMFPHLFQHWLTAGKASHFKLSIAAFPVCVMITFVPCVLIGMWAAAEPAILELDKPPPLNAILPMMVSLHSGEILSGLIGAGILAAIMSSLDSQFLCLGSMFTNDVYVPYFAGADTSPARIVWAGRFFVLLVVVATYLIALVAPKDVFALGVWCFTGFSSLFPILLGAIYWKRSNKYGAIASVVTVAGLWLYFTADAIREGSGFLIYGMAPVTFVLLASAVAFVVVSLVTPAPDPALGARFFPSKEQQRGKH